MDHSTFTALKKDLAKNDESSSKVKGTAEFDEQMNLSVYPCGAGL